MNYYGNLMELCIETTLGWNPILLWLRVQFVIYRFLQKQNKFKAWKSPPPKKLPTGSMIPFKILTWIWKKTQLLKSYVGEIEDELWVFSFKYCVKCFHEKAINETERLFWLLLGIGTFEIFDMILIFP